MPALHLYTNDDEKHIDFMPTPLYPIPRTPCYEANTSPTKTFCPAKIVVSPATTAATVIEKFPVCTSLKALMLLSFTSQCSIVL